MEGLLTPPPNKGREVALLFPASTGTAVCFAGETLEISKWPELELFCLAVGHISSLGPGVSGGETNQSAGNKSTGNIETIFGKRLLI